MEDKPLIPDEEWENRYENSLEGILESLYELNTAFAEVKRDFSEKINDLDQIKRNLEQYEIEYKKILLRLEKFDTAEKERRTKSSEEVIREWKEKREREIGILEKKTDIREIPLPERLDEIKTESRWKTFARYIGNISFVLLLGYLSSNEIFDRKTDYRKVAPFAAVSVAAWIYSGSRRKTSVNGYREINS